MLDVSVSCKVGARYWTIVVLKKFFCMSISVLKYPVRIGCCKLWYNMSWTDCISIVVENNSIHLVCSRVFWEVACFPSVVFRVRLFGSNKLWEIIQCWLLADNKKANKVKKQRPSDRVKFWQPPSPWLLTLLTACPSWANLLLNQKQPPHLTTPW